MAKLYFRYGAMSSSKTANALMVKYNYGERGQNALLVKPAIDVRDGVRTVKSRCGLSSECVLFHEMDIAAIKRGDYDCIIVDEAQFLSKDEVRLLTDIVDEYNVPVICYGLRTDFQGNFFEGSHWLMAWADTIEEIKNHLLVRPQGHMQRPPRRQRRHNQGRRAGSSRCKRQIHRPLQKTLAAWRSSVQTFRN